MAKKSEQPILNVPPLRFPEFKGEWEKDKASVLLECFSTNSLTWDDLNFECGKMRDVHYGLIHKGFNKSIMPADSKLIPWINSEKEPKRYTKIKDGDLILADASEDTNECGEPVELSGCLFSNVVAGLHTIHCRDRKSFSVPGFKSFLFKSAGIKKQLYRLCEGTKIYSICPSTLDEVVLRFPKKEEQQRIVKLLSSLEDRLAVQRKIIEDLRALSKTICVKAYQNFETNRFLIQDLGSESTVSSFSKEDLNNDGVQAVFYGELFTDYSIIIDRIKSRIDDRKVTVRSEKNDLLFPTSTTVDALSLVSPAAIRKSGVALGGDMFVIHVNNAFSNVFLSVYFNYIFRRNLAKFAQGTTIVHLHYESIKKIEVAIPRLEEQKRIAKIFESCSKRLLSENEILSDLLRLKCAFFQQLFR